MWHWSCNGFTPSSLWSKVEVNFCQFAYGMINAPLKKVPFSPRLSKTKSAVNAKINRASCTKIEFLKYTNFYIQITKYSHHFVRLSLSANMSQSWATEPECVEILSGYSAFILIIELLKNWLIFWFVNKIFFLLLLASWYSKYMFKDSWRTWTKNLAFRGYHHEQ